MPIYEYRCEACGFEKDALQKMSDAPLVDCPECGKATFKKRISAAGFRLSGTGWYETDFKTGSKKNIAGAKDPSTAGKTENNKAATKEKGSSESKKSSADSKSAVSKKTSESK